MLESLKVLNGELTPAFNQNNDTYTVQVSSDVFHLDLDYQVQETAIVNVYGNENFLEGENKVTIVVENEDEVSTYTLVVMKEKVKTTSSFNLEANPVEITKELPNYVAPLIAIICFLLILFTFKILFLKKKHKN